ncbi:TPA: hypothetical protein DDW35_00985, partial [Candidatus Sumerlaeota bacterium]|nr:hypothetical protein [Candidatus Sumerlaeota bacterium]
EQSPALLMGIGMGCCGFVGGHTDHVNQLAAISWIPWIITEALLVLRRPRLAHSVLLAIFVAMQMLAGHPQYVIYTLIYLTAVAVIYFVYYHHRRKSYEPPSWIGLGLLAAGIIVGVGLSSAQTLPSAELSPRSLRMLDPPERMFVDSYPPRNLISLLVPQAFGNPVQGLHNMDGTPLSETDLGMFARDQWAKVAGIGSEFEAFAYNEWVMYMGLATIIFAGIALITLFHEFLVRCFFFLMLFSLIMAVGSYIPITTPPYKMVVTWIPGGENLRVPARFLIFFCMSVVVLAAVGFNQVLYFLRERLRAPDSTLALVRILILVVVFGDLFYFSKTQMFRYNDTDLILREKGPALTFFEQNPGEYKIFRQMVEVPYNTDGNQIAARQREKREATRRQIQRLQPNLNRLSNVQVDNGYEEGLLPTFSYWLFEHTFHRNLRSMTPDTTLMGLMNIKYLMTDRFYKEGESSGLIPQNRYAILEQPLPVPDATKSTRPYYQELPAGIWPTTDAQSEQFLALYENRNFCPKFAWGAALRNQFDFKALETNVFPTRALLSTLETPTSATYAYRKNALTSATAVSTIPTAALGNFTFTRESANSFLLQKSAKDEGEIIMLEGDYPGWVCRWENKVVPLKRVNACMMSCDAPVGPSKLHFQFEPFSFRLGAFISCLFVLLLSSCVFFLDFPTKLGKPRKRGRGSRGTNGE